jgi:hypothetical protein
MEWWSGALFQYSNTPILQYSNLHGVVEWWSDGVMECSSNTPILQYSNLHGVMEWWSDGIEDTERGRSASDPW